MLNFTHSNGWETKTSGKCLGLHCFFLVEEMFAKLLIFMLEYLSLNYFLNSYLNVQIMHNCLPNEIAKIMTKYSICHWLNKQIKHTIGSANVGLVQTDIIYILLVYSCFIKWFNILTKCLIVLIIGICPRSISSRRTLKKRRNSSEWEQFGIYKSYTCIFIS